MVVVALCALGLVSITCDREEAVVCTGLRKLHLDGILCLLVEPRECCSEGLATSHLLLAQEPLDKASHAFASKTTSRKIGTAKAVWLSIKNCDVSQPAKDPIIHICSRNKHRQSTQASSVWISENTHAKAN